QDRSDVDLANRDGERAPCAKGWGAAVRHADRDRINTRALRFGGGPGEGPGRRVDGRAGGCAGVEGGGQRGRRRGGRVARVRRERRERLFVEVRVGDGIESGGAMDRPHGDDEGLRGGGVHAAVRRAAVVLQRDGHRRRAVGVGSGREGQRAGGGDGRLDGE